MKRILPSLLILFVIFFASGPAFGWKNKIAENQFRAVEYITKLQNGANPDELTRPTIRHDKKARAKAANRELREAMDEAEKLARAGKYEQIKLPSFKRVVSEENYQQIEKELQ